jgi:hypothetical protein
MQFEALHWCSGVSLALMCLPSYFPMWRLEDVTLLRSKDTASSARIRWPFEPLDQNLVLSLRLVSSTSRPVLFFGNQLLQPPCFDDVCASPM